MVGWQQELQELGYNIEEEEFAANLLTSLPDSWDNWVSGIDIDAAKDSMKVIGCILQQNKKSDAKVNSDETALTVQSHKKPNFNKQSGSQPDYKTKGCHHCGCPGHCIIECCDKKANKSYTEEQKHSNYEYTMNFCNLSRQPQKAHIFVNNDKDDEDKDDKHNFIFMAQTSNKSELTREN